MKINVYLIFFMLCIFLMVWGCTHKRSELKQVGNQKASLQTQDSLYSWLVSSKNYTDKTHYKKVF